MDIIGQLVDEVAARVSSRVVEDTADLVMQRIRTAISPPAAPVPVMREHPVSRPKSRRGRRVSLTAKECKAALKESGGVIAKAARALGVSTPTFKKYANGK